MTESGQMTGVRTATGSTEPLSRNRRETAGVPCFTPPQGFGSLHLDLGCAGGTFLQAAALRFPEDFFLGVEQQSGRVLRSVKKIVRSGLANAAVVTGTMPGILENIVAEHTASWIHVLFPDPWPKRRHAARRLLQMSSPPLFGRLLHPGGRLRFLTDQEPYWLLAAGAFARAADWDLLADDPVEGWPLSEFHLRFAEKGLPVFGGIFQYSPRS